ncbi:MAG: hypothetical protein EP323_01910, partial [Gammaproteobacteria bacterium]
MKSLKDVLLGKQWVIPLFALVGISGGAALADHLLSHGDVEPQSGFEIEGNLEVGDFPNAENPAQGVIDWANAYAKSGGDALLIADPHSDSQVDPSVFIQGGKFKDPAGWTIGASQVGGSQVELTNVMAWAVAPGDLGDAPTKPEDELLILAGERTKDEGTFALDFEVNQVPWACEYIDGVCHGGPTRTVNDILVGFELSGNPDDPQQDLQVLIAVYDPNNTLDNNVCEVIPGSGNVDDQILKGTDPCPTYGDNNNFTGFYYRYLSNAEILPNSGYGVATMNAAPVTELGTGFPGGYTSYNESGADDGIINEFEFFEAAIDLGALGVDVGCPGFGSVHAKSRASLAPTADIKDLSGPAPLPVECYINVFKYYDKNANGTFDGIDVGLPGWTINLRNQADNALVATLDTANDGTGTFEAVADGTYKVEEDCTGEGSQWAQTEPTATALTNAACGTGKYENLTIDIDNKTASLNFGNTELGKLVIRKKSIGGSDTFNYDTDVVDGDTDATSDVSINSTEDSFVAATTIEGLLPGTNYNVNELDPGILWDLTSASCTLEGGGSGNSGGNNSLTLSGVIIEPGKTTTCDFVNTKRGLLKVVKNTVGGTGTFTINNNGIAGLST